MNDVPLVIDEGMWRFEELFGHLMPEIANKMCESFFKMPSEKCSVKKSIQYFTYSKQFCVVGFLFY